MRGLAGAVLALPALAAPARAECLGQGCYDGLLWMLVAVVLGGLALLGLAVWLIVGAIRGAKRRRTP